MTERLRGLAQPAFALAAAMLVAAIIIWLTSGYTLFSAEAFRQPFEALGALARGAFGETSAIMRTLTKSTPLILSGLAVAIALRAGLFNIGVEGQLLVGGLASAWVGFAFKGLPWFAHLPLALLAGAFAGAIWAAVPGVLRAWRGAHEVIVTIMMNYIAIHLCHYLVNNLLRDKNTLSTATPRVLQSAQLWMIEVTKRESLSSGFFLALAAAGVFAFLVKRMALGFEIRAVGQQPEAARAAGISVGATMVRAMVISGALAGLAGAVEVLAVHRRFLDAFSPGYGFDSIAVALLGGLNAGGVVLAGILFGALNSGSTYMETMASTPRQIAGIVQAVVILAVGAKYLKRRS
jgi:simple sugar transport system permease protein